MESTSDVHYLPPFNVPLLLISDPWGPLGSRQFVGQFFALMSSGMQFKSLETGAIIEPAVKYWGSLEKFTGLPEEEEDRMPVALPQTAPPIEPSVTLPAIASDNLPVEVEGK